MIVSFVIPNYNGEKYIYDCLSSVYSQNVKSIKGLEELEVILVDNASTDDSVFIAQRKFKGLKVILSRTNAGTAAALNRGIAEARGDFVAILHVDTVLEETWLKNALDVFEEKPNVFAASSLVVKNGDEKIIDCKGYGFTKGGYAFKVDGGKSLLKAVKKRKVIAPYNAAALYKKEIVRALGGFDEKFFLYLEDADMGIRAYLRGFETVYNSSAVAYHQGFTLSDGEECDFTVRFKSRNNMYLRYKNLTAIQRFNNKPWLSKGIKRFKKHYGGVGFGANVEQGINEAVYTRKSCAKEYKGSKFKRRFMLGGKMFGAVFASKNKL